MWWYRAPFQVTSMSLKQVGLTKKINKSLIYQVQKQTYASILHREKQGKPKKTEYAHRKLNMTMTNKWLFLSTPKQQTDSQEDSWKWDNKEVVVAIPGKTLLKQPSDLLCETLFSSSSSSLPPLVQKNIFLFMQCWYPPPVSAVVLSITPTSSLPSLPPIPSVCPEQLTHQLFFLHLQALLAAQERLFLRVARKNNKNNRK